MAAATRRDEQRINFVVGVFVIADGTARKRLVIHAALDGGAFAKATTPDGPPALNEGT